VVAFEGVNMRSNASDTSQTPGNNKFPTFARILFAVVGLETQTVKLGILEYFLSFWLYGVTADFPV
jgi:hypothetical protein